MSEAIQVAYLIDTISSDKAGTEKQLLQIVERLNRKEVIPTLIFLYDSPFTKSHDFTCETVSLGYRGILKPGFPLVICRYLSLLKSRRFQVVQTFFEDSVVVGVLGRLFSGHGHSLVIGRRDLGLGADELSYHRILKRLRPFFLRLATGVVTNSQAIKEHVERHDRLEPEKIKVIPNGLEIEVAPRSRPPLLDQYPEAVWVGIAANLKPVKRIDLLVRALAELKRSAQGAPVHVAVLGEGRLRPELVALAEELGVAGQMHFLGAVDDVFGYLQHLDVAVLCSDTEGLSNAVLEYMVCGLPVVATAVGGNRELVDHCNGICIPPGDHLALAEALSGLAASPELRKRLGEGSLQKVRGGFAWISVMKQWEKYYASLVARG